MYDPSRGTMKVAAFMSGSGTNLTRLIERQKEYEIVLIFTDAEGSNAVSIGNKFGIPVYCRDIKQYYQERNKPRSDMAVRAEYDAATASLLKEKGVDVVALCGYMSIVTDPVLSNFLVLNVHPADLRVMDNGKRRYAGCMGVECVRQALEHGDEIRSSVHIVTAGVDEGPVLAVSEAVNAEGKDEKTIQQRLKEQGDWVVFPEVLQNIAAGRYRREGATVYLDGEEVRNDALKN